MRLKKKNSYTSAIYLRLSREDGDKMESDSIQNQRELVKQFLQTHPEIKETREFVDDGYSGTNFDRPAFSKMMGEVERGNIDCIIVKDLSRLGRNYIETGKYVERVFPLMQVRFISINDSYDNTDQNNDAEDIIIPFKNLINDSYCRDISIKIRSQLDVKRKNGKFIGSFAAYGYCKDPEDRNHLIIDEYAAGIVKMIFDYKLQGYSSGKIADILNEMGVLTPMAYKRSCGFDFNSGFRISEDVKWMPQMVSRILMNELYIGTVVQGKNRKINYKVKESRPVDASEWIRVEDAHEAIIPKDVFETVQSLMLKDTRTAPEESQVDLFSGFLICGDCGQSLVRRSAVKKGRKYYYYHCSTYKAGKGCFSHLISSEKLKDTVTETIRLQIAQLIEADELLKQMEDLPGKRLKAKTFESQKQALTKELERYGEMKLRVYQDMVDQVVTKDEYRELANRFEEKIKKAKRSLLELGRKEKELKIDVIRTQPWIQEFKEYRNVQTLSRKILATLVESIVVYGKDSIEIRFRYMDEIQTMIEYANAHEADLRIAVAQ